MMFELMAADNASICISASWVITKSCSSANFISLPRLPVCCQLSMSTNGTTAVAAATGGKRPSTNIGEPLSEESLRLVREVRRQLTVPLHSNFDSDFNVYRFVANAERTQKARNRKELVDAAARALNGHLRVRNCLRLDDLPDVPFERNRLFREHFLPTSPILEGIDSQNRLLWFIEYRSLSVETIAHGIRSSESIRCQFWQFEHMLRKVNEQERRSGRLSSVRHVVDMAGYELNPFTFGFLSSGTLSYYSQLLHYDNYPELVYPIEMVNIAKWIHIPYRLIKAMMPAGFTDRFRLHDDNFLEAMSSEIPIEHIPRTLGGQNPTRCVPAQRMAASQYWQPSHPALLGQLETVQIGPRKHKLFRVQIQEQQQQQQKGGQQQLQQQVLSWYLRTDGDIFFGVFYEPPPPTKAEQQRGDSLRQHNGNGHGHQEVIKIGNGKDYNIHQPPENEQKQQQSPATVEHMETVFEWVYPLFKLTAKIHHEWDCVDCSRPGTYWLLLSNRHSWLHRRTVDVLVQLSGAGKDEAEEANGTTDGSSGSWTKRIWQDGGEELLASESRPLMDVRACLQLEPAHMFGPRD